QHAVADHIIDLIEDHQIVAPALHLRPPKLPGLFAKPYVFRIRLRTANLYKTPAHSPNLEMVCPQHLRRIQFAVMPGALDELHHKHTQALTHGPKASAQRASRLALARAGIDNEQTFLLGHSAS